MRRLLTFVFLMMGICSWAQSQHEHTTDKVDISAATLTPGGDYVEITATMTNPGNYSAFGLDIVLPKGYVFEKALNDDDELVYANRGTLLKTNHMIASNVQTNGALRVTAFSLSSLTFKSEGTLFKFYVRATPYAKPGNVDVQIMNCFFTTAAAVQYDTDDITIDDKLTTDTEAKVPLTVSSTAKWGTCVLPFGINAPTGVKVFSASDADEEYLYLEEESRIEAYTPYILFAASGYSAQLQGTVDASLYPAGEVISVNGLNGTVADKEITEGYVLQNLSEGVKLYPIAPGNSFVMPAGKCWLDVETVAAKSLGFFILDPSSINSTSTQEHQHTTIYSLDGKVVTTPVSGQMYIMNGKKVIKK